MGKLGGRPEWKPTAKDHRLVEAMVAGGLEQERIATALGVAPKTLRKHLRRALDSGADRANAEVIAAMFGMATRGRPSYVKFQAARYWLACRCGWREPERLLLTSIKPLSEMSKVEFDEFLVANGEEPAGLDPVGPNGDRVVPFPRRRR